MYVIATVSDATWGFLGVFTTASATIVVALITLLVRQGKATGTIEEISRAVNHQAAEAPTLVERVIGIEKRTEVIELETHRHRTWEHQVFSAIAHHVGFDLPERDDVA